jgi:putative FmdB family regulatory protein
MPIYEFYCKECHTVFKFFSRSVNTDKIPSCPQNTNHQLERQVSAFATLIGGKKDAAGEGDTPPFDEAKMERAMAMLAKDADKIDENDPRQAARLMRKLSDATGLKMGSGMEEALTRMERGEDPDKIEAEMGDLLEGEEPFVVETKPKKGGSKPKPKIDERLYDL